MSEEIFVYKTRRGTFKARIRISEFQGPYVVPKQHIFYTEECTTKIAAYHEVLREILLHHSISMPKIAIKVTI